MLTTLANVKTVLGITSSAEDALLNLILPGVDRALKDLLHQEIEQAAYTEFRDGENTEVLRLRQRPIAANGITSVSVDPTGAYGAGPDAFATPLVAGTDYALKPDQPDGSSRGGLLIRLRGTWLGGVAYTAGLLYPGVVPSRGSIKVVYTAGYLTANIPADLILTEILVVSRIRQMRQYGVALQSESYDGYSYSLQSALPNLFDATKHLWLRYRPLDLA